MCFVSKAALLASLLAGGVVIEAANTNRPKTEFFSFAGHLKKDGQALDGAVQMKFAISDPHDVILWTNDGSGVIPPITPIDAVIIGGKYSVRIGDTSITNMTEIDPEIGKVRNLFLKVWISNSSGEFEYMKPDLPFGTVPRAYAANSVDGVGIEKIVQTTGAVMEGPISMNSNRITGLPEPEALDEAATKNFILDTISSSLSSTSELKVKKITGTDGFCVANAANVTKFSVDSQGNVTANAFIGDGSRLTNLNIGTVTVDSSKVTDGSLQGADLADATISDSKLQQITTANKVAASAVEDKFLRNDGHDTTSGNITANAFIGDGSRLTNVSATTISPDASSGNIAFTGNLVVAGVINGTSFIGDGSGLTNLPVSAITIGSSNITDGSILNADIASGANISDSKLAQITTANKVAASAVEDKFLRNDGHDTTSGNITANAFIGDGSRLTNISASSVAADSSGNLTVTGNVVATKFVGDGSGLTGLSSSGNNIWADYAIFYEQKNSGASLGSFSTGWSNVGLNTTQSTRGSSISRNGTTITLAAGEYFITGTISHGTNKAIASRFSSSSNNLYGMYVVNDGSLHSFTSKIEGVITVSASEDFTLKRYSGAASNNVFSNNNNTGAESRKVDREIQQH
jgi:cation transport regulator ChaB